MACKGRAYDRQCLHYLVEHNGFACEQELAEECADTGDWETRAMHTNPRRKRTENAFDGMSFIPTLCQRMLYELGCHFMRSVRLYIIGPKETRRM